MPTGNAFIFVNVTSPRSNNRKKKKFVTFFLQMNRVDGPGFFIRLTGRFEILYVHTHVYFTEMNRILVGDFVLIQHIFMWNTFGVMLMINTWTL